MTAQDFDVVVIGGGHAGCEAAAAAARIGARTALLTQRLETIGEMSCNPAIGGIGKGHLVREIDALDGLMGRAADRAGIHFKVLNRRKGPAVRGPRAQADRALYKQAIRALLDETSGLVLLEGGAEGLVFDPGGRLAGVSWGGNQTLRCRAVVVCAGTFLRGMIHVGARQSPAGRLGEAPSVALAASLAGLALPVGRLKTGTPPRLYRASIDWQGLDPDYGDDPPEAFSTMTASIETPQLECRVTGTTEATHRLVRDHLHRSAVYGGHIAGRGPRYCPSLEDKVVRFPDRDRHQVFLEPEGLESDLVYPNGLSISMPEEIQRAVVRTLPGLERAELARAGYAVEYDYVDPRALSLSLEVRALPGLFLAGQVNGTTGYEEAAGQGLLAGVNAARRAAGLDPVMLSRADAYIGVMVDDLTARGVTEPYRMFTSRSEYRLTLRADNADQRLTEIGIDWGCVGVRRQEAFRAFAQALAHARAKARADGATPGLLARHGIQVKADGPWRSVSDLLGTGADLPAMTGAFPWLDGLPPRVFAELATEAIYAGYLARQDADLRLFRRDEGLSLEGIEWKSVPGLSGEVRSKLLDRSPVSIGAAARIEGMTPAALVALTVLALKHASREA